jgi:hypothetical protein
MVGKRALHLSQDSPLLPIYRTMLRLKAADRLRQLPTEAYYSFSVLFSADPATQREIQASFLKFLATMEKKVKGCQPSEVYQLTFDLLPWSVEESAAALPAGAST